MSDLRDTPDVDPANPDHLVTDPDTGTNSHTPTPIEEHIEPLDLPMINMRFGTFKKMVTFLEFAEEVDLINDAVIGQKTLEGAWFDIWKTKLIEWAARRGRDLTPGLLDRSRREAEIKVYPFYDPSGATMAYWLKKKAQVWEERGIRIEVTSHINDSNVRKTPAEEKEAILLEKQDIAKQTRLRNEAIHRESIIPSDEAKRQGEINKQKDARQRQEMTTRERRGRKEMYRRAARGELGNHEDQEPV